MASKGRIPPILMHPPLGSAILHHDTFSPAVHPLPPGPLPLPFDMLPHPELMEQKLMAQSVEMQKLATENQRLAATHSTLRQALAAAQHELQILHSHIGTMKSEREQQMNDLADKIGKMEGEAKSAESVKLELKQAQFDAETLVLARQGLLSKVHQLTQDLHRAHADAQQIPALTSELESLTQEYQRYRISFEHEKKLYTDHLESLQVMERNYISMAKELEKLRSDLAKTGGSHVSSMGNTGNEISGRPTVQNMYQDGYGVPQVQGHSANPGTGATSTVPVANAGMGGSTPNYTGVQPGPAHPRHGYDSTAGSGYDASRYDTQRTHNYESQRAAGYNNVQRVPSYDSHRIAAYGAQATSIDAGGHGHYGSATIAARGSGNG